MLETLAVIHIIDKRGGTLAVSNLVSMKKCHFKRGFNGLARGIRYECFAKSLVLRRLTGIKCGLFGMENQGVNGKRGTRVLKQSL